MSEPYRATGNDGKVYELYSTADRVPVNSCPNCAFHDKPSDKQCRAADILPTRHSIQCLRSGYTAWKEVG